MNGNVKKVIEFAKGWDNKNLRNYGIKNVPDQTCAFFVRFVFTQALHQAGQMPVAHTRPYYSEHHVQALPTNENFADGLAGDVIGPKVNFQQIQAGDILLFKDTYYAKHGEFPVGSITHVGIALDSNGMMADSSGGQCYVRNYKIYFPNKLVEVRRPRCLGIVAANSKGISLSKGQVQKSGVSQELKVLFGASDFERNVMHKFAGPKPRVVIDQKSVQYQYITVDVVLADGKHVKLFHHDGRTGAFVGGNKVPYLNVEAKLQGGLHVWVEGKEVKATSVNIGIS